MAVRFGALHELCFGVSSSQEAFVGMHIQLATLGELQLSRVMVCS